LAHLVLRPSLSTEANIPFRLEIEQLRDFFGKYFTHLQNVSSSMALRRANKQPTRTLDNAAHVDDVAVSSVPHRRYKPLREMLETADVFSPILLNAQEFFPPPNNRAPYLEGLCLPFPAKLLRYAHGNYLGTLNFIWKVPDAESLSESSNSESKVYATILPQIPIFRSRAEKKEFSTRFANLRKLDSVVLTNIFQYLTQDETSCHSSTKETQLRLSRLLDCDDGSHDIAVDLRVTNGRPESKVFDLTHSGRPLSAFSKERLSLTKGVMVRWASFLWQYLLRT
jgi:hypothetical protein